MKHPIQPLEIDAHGVQRFKKNAIVDFLLDWSRGRGMGLNELAVMPLSQEDHQQLAQLIGYSLSGYGDLSYVDDAAYESAVLMADNPEMSSNEARIAVLEEQLRSVRNGLREPIAALYGVHPDDLGEPDA